MIPLRSALPIFATGFAALVVFWLGFHIRGEMDRGACEAARRADLLRSNEVLDRHKAATDRCEEQVDKFNESVIEAQSRIAELTEQQAERDRLARQDAAAREQRQNERAALVASALEDLRGKIENADFGPCAGEPYTDDLVGVLNDAITAARGSRDTND